MRRTWRLPCLPGRLTKEEGPEAAIRIANAAGIELRMAAKVPRAETRYYKERLQPLVDGENIKLVGELNDSAKGDLLRGALALLFPID
jgi:glycosyltransferase involved in cell wall biosynthesis